MVYFILEELEGLLLQCWLYPIFRVMCYGITLSDYNFFGVLEKHNPNICTFFTLVAEMGFTLHEMFEVSGLSMGDRPYEEYIPGTEDIC